MPRAFPGIPPAEAEESIADGEVKLYPAGAIRCHEGEFYIVLQEEVEVTKVINNREVRFFPCSFWDVSCSDTRQNVWRARKQNVSRVNARDMLF